MERKGKIYRRNQNKVVCLPKRPVHLQTGHEDLHMEFESDSDVELNLIDMMEVLVPAPVQREEIVEDGLNWDEVLDSDDSEGGWVAVGGRRECSQYGHLRS